MPSTRAEIGARKRERTRAALVDAAMRVFARVGPDAATIDDIIAEATVARGTFYNYFTTRDDVVAAIATQISDRVLTELTDLHRVADPAERVSRIVRTFIRVAAIDPIKGWIIIRIALLAAPFDALMRDMLAADVEEGRKKGRFRTPSAQAAYDAILGLSLMGMRSVLQGEAPPAHAEHIAEMVLVVLGVTDAAEISSRQIESQADRSTRNGAGRR